MGRDFSNTDRVATYVDGIIVTGDLARRLATTIVIESPNPVVRRVSNRVTNYRDVAMAMRCTTAGLLDGDKAFGRLRDHHNMATLLGAKWPVPAPLKKAA